MPCKPAKAKHLLKAGKAKVIKRIPFTIQLCFVCENKTQPIVLGIDSGSKYIGFSAISEKKELVSGEVVLDNKTADRLKEKAMYRRNRRSRHHWYRQARFLNRKGNELPPSVKRKYETHLSIISRIKKILPITQIRIEVGNFDIQKINNPDITNTEYQQGSRYGYENTKAYILAREKYICQLCGKTVIGTKTNIHHSIPRSKGGTVIVNNLVLLHEKCHNKVHKQGLKFKKNKQYKEAIFMSIIHKRFWRDIKDLQICYGYETMCKRRELEIPKSHVNDAFIIAGGCVQERCIEYKIMQKHRHNRGIQLNRKGYKPSIRTSIYKIQPKDLVWVDNKQHEVKAISNKGKYVQIKNIKKSTPITQIQKHYFQNGLVWQITPELYKKLILAKVA